MFWVLAVVFLAAPASAQNGLDLNTDLQDFLPAAGPSDFLTVPSPFVSPHRSVGFGLLVNHLHAPLTLEAADGSEAEVVRYQTTADFLWSFGLFDRVELSLALPVIVAQSGRGVAPLACPDLDDCAYSDLATTAIRDVRVGAKLRLSKTGIASTMAVLLSASLPSGDEENFAGQSNVTVSPAFAMGGIRLGRHGTATAVVGGRVRAATEVGSARFGSEAWGRLGLGAELVDRFHLTLEGFGTISLTDGASERQELLAGARYQVDRARDLTMEAGLGIGLSEAPGSAAFRGILGIRYAPLGRDSDSDGVPDRSDACFSVREDRDGFEDRDGCPDEDNDGDEIPDRLDRCDGEAEDRDSWQDEDGCPEGDNDEDGFPDGEDECPESAEDEDDFEDQDGCADPDNDGDGVEDAADRCPAEGEDLDEYEDGDGCPDADNDSDGLLDARDPCPSEAEDRDGFEDDDGCPDPDDDQDGVSDAADRCRREGETLNGSADSDGCPDPGASWLAWQGDTVVFRRPLRFAASESNVTPAMAPLLDVLAQTLRGRTRVQYSIFGHGDRPGDSAPEVELGARRAEALRRALIDRGIASERIDARGRAAASANAPHIVIRAVAVAVQAPRPTLPPAPAGSVPREPATEAPPP